MVRWYYPSVFDELEEMRKYMESLSRQMYETNPRVLLSGSVEPGTKMLPGERAGLRVDVAETKKEVIVTADMIPGVTKKDITLLLIGPKALEISCACKVENEQEEDGYFRRECRFGSMTRVIPLPREVSEDGARASFRNGVIEVRLKKAVKEMKGKIVIE